MKVNGRWAYLYRAVDGRGRTVDFYLPPVVTAKLHTGFWVKSSNVKSGRSRFINTDKAPAYGRALALLKHAKAGARLTLNTDRLSTGTT